MSESDTCRLLDAKADSERPAWAARAGAAGAFLSFHISMLFASTGMVSGCFMASSIAA